jgi:arylsulfatase A-like enzyme
MHHKEAKHAVLPLEIDTLAELAQRSGYRTVALVDHPGIREMWNYDQGFDVFVRLFEKGGYPHWATTEASFVAEEFSAQLEVAPDDRLFVYLHVIYPHRPYAPPPRYAALFEEPSEHGTRASGSRDVDRYDGEIRYSDDLVGSLIDELERRGMLSSTWVVVTSDHGEGFGEHGLADHGRSFFNEVLKVPLILHPPGGRSTEPAIVEEPISNIDLFPTLLEIMGAEAPPEAEGRSLFRYFSQARPPANLIFSESPHSRDIGAAAHIHGKLKYVSHTNAKIAPQLLYHLEDDPAEQENLAGTHSSRREMHERLVEHRKRNKERRRRVRQERRQADAETNRRLRALGYVE